MKKSDCGHLSGRRRHLGACAMEWPGADGRLVQLGLAGAAPATKASTPLPGVQHLDTEPAQRPRAALRAERSH